MGNSIHDVLHAILDTSDDAILAVIAGVSGPSYRPLGAMMAILDESNRTGSLSSGCIENDIAQHAIRARHTNRTMLVRYGEGSPFVDIRLPCGGGLEILLIPYPDKQALALVAQKRARREPCTLEIDIDNGEMTVSETGATRRARDRLSIRCEPDVLFQVFGKGPEASTFCALVRATALPGMLISPDRETLLAAKAKGVPGLQLTSPSFPRDLETDNRTAIVLFFHDHDWEPPILAAALKTSAFYIGAQGSVKARNARIRALADLGVSKQECARLYGPVGLIPSARDAHTLAVSVLAEVLAVSMAG